MSKPDERDKWTRFSEEHEQIRFDDVRRTVLPKTAIDTGKAPYQGTRTIIKRPKWITRSIAEELGREYILLATCYEILIYFAFVVCVCISVMGPHSTYNFYLTKGLHAQFVDKAFNTMNGMEITFSDIHSAGDFWMYLENHFVPSIFWGYTYDPKNVEDENTMNIMFENMILGVPRIRQVKARNDSCEVHDYFLRYFRSCFDTYYSYEADREDFGPGEPTAWTYSSEKDTKSLPYWGQISTYGGDGFYVDLVRNRTGTKQIIEDLKWNMWIERGTRAVFIDFTVYNGNKNLFAVCKLVFEFPAVGGVITKAEIHTMKLLRFSRNWDMLLLALELVSYIFVAYYLLQAIREMVHFKWNYMLKFWNYVDLTIISLSIAAGVFSFMEYIHAPPTMKTIVNNPDVYGNVEYLASIYTSKRELVAVMLFLVIMKVFKYLNFNRTMGQLNSTLRQCAKDIVGFSLMFFIVFFAFSELGYLLFGSEVENFSSFGLAMFTLLRTILGDFNYDELERADRVLAPIYFLSYIFLVFFVLLNMFLAIINDTYNDVKTEISIAPDELQMTEYLRDKLHKVLQKVGVMKDVSKKHKKSPINATIRQVREVLTNFSGVASTALRSKCFLPDMASIKWLKPE
ncbi:unnamed protein product [Acanthoscelides obtectus]|uniref:Uncharacterized protein n=1 Tax=Acanthoscelides obtectus TaxID=200917 RepID=A0A9P0PXM9_ACAOB|nr:unnamed protein product [Acanthoscelides obtectus]CAK1667801.1 Polycystic kidney disease 2-like 1 protein [Acanthoscelides obtectus]